MHSYTRTCKMYSIVPKYDIQAQVGCLTRTLIEEGGETTLEYEARFAEYQPYQYKISWTNTDNNSDSTV